MLVVRYTNKKQKVVNDEESSVVRHRSGQNSTASSLDSTASTAATHICQAVDVSVATGLTFMKCQELPKTGCILDLEAAARNALPFARGTSNLLISDEANCMSQIAEERHGAFFLVIM